MKEEKDLKSSGERVVQHCDMTGEGRPDRKAQRASRRALGQRANDNKVH